MGLAQNGMGPASVTWDGLGAWCLLMQIELEPWEVRTMVHLGVIRANVQAEKMKTKTPTGRK